MIAVVAAFTAGAITPAFADAETLYQQHCAVCHGADFGGYIGPALNRDALARHNAAYVRNKVATGGVDSLMPSHPSWSGTLSRQEIAELADLVKGARVREAPDAGRYPRLARGSGGRRGRVAGQAGLPDRRRGRPHGRHRARTFCRRSGGQDRLLQRQDQRGRGRACDRYAPHLIEYHPTQPRWAYATTDAGYLSKIDLHSLKPVRRIRVGLNGVSLAVSRDGRYVAALLCPRYRGDPACRHARAREADALARLDPDGKPVDADSGAILGTPIADVFVMVLEQAGQVWIVDLAVPDMPVTRIEKVGRHLHDAFLSPSGRHVLVSSYDDDVAVVVDLLERKVVRRMTAGRKPHFGSGAVIRVDGRTLGIGTNIGAPPHGPSVVSVFDMETFEVVKQIPVLGPTESPAAHPDAPHIVVDIVGKGPDTGKIQLIDKHSLEVVRTITVGGHSQFPEYTADGRHLYVSAGYRGNRLVIYDARTWRRVKSVAMESPAGIFSHRRSRAVAIGLE
ncbi:MAG: nitrite reductase [Xanthobacteraceae bacterium]|nr:nitrite reductase [Xanthobacteraceae bacterium]